MNSTALILFGRYPHPGKVKTRLAATTGDEFAADIYKACCEHIFDEFETIGGTLQRFFFYSDGSDGPLAERWPPPSYSCVPQHGRDLGERLSNASAFAFERGFHRCIITGTDVPDVSGDLIKNAIDSLETVDLVIGPARDGGYYLLGTRTHMPEVFQDIAWSCDTVLADTLRSARRLGMSSILLPELVDLDTEGDLQAWLHSKTAGGESHHPLFSLLRRSWSFKEQES
ncbi:MAG: TIGR04282 family arsenosugar biosynthesis glycosyltransferase [Bacteroidota bacterium]